MKCPTCGKTIPDNVKICPSCGANVPELSSEVDIIEDDPLYTQRWQKFDTFAILGFAVPALTGLLAFPAGFALSFMGLRSKKAKWSAIAGIAASCIGLFFWLFYFIFRFATTSS